MRARGSLIVENPGQRYCGGGGGVRGVGAGGMIRRDVKEGTRVAKER